MELSKNLNLLLSKAQGLSKYNLLRYFHIVANSSKRENCPYAIKALRLGYSEADELIQHLKELREKIDQLIPLIQQGKEDYEAENSLQE